MTKREILLQTYEVNLSKMKVETLLDNFKKFRGNIKILSARELNRRIKNNSISDQDKLNILILIADYL